MDAIQLALDVHLKRTIYNSQRFFLQQNELSEATYPLLISHLAWLRKINATPNKIDVMHQNVQKNREFKFLCKRNLLFFLTITGQFNIIEKLFKTPSLTTKLHHLITLIKKEHKIRQKKRTLLKATCSPKAKTRNPEQNHNAYSSPTIGLFKQGIKKPLQLSFEYPVRRINIFYLAYISKIELLGKILKAIQTNPNLQSHIKKALLHQIATVHRRALKNKALFTTPINQNAPTPRIFALIRQAWKQLHDEVLEINSIFNQCKCLSPELEKINRGEITASMKRVDELENLMQKHYGVYDEIDRASDVRRDAEQRAEVYTQTLEDSSSAVEFGKCSTIKNSHFVSHHLTFFSPPQKNENSMSLEPNFNFNEPKTENNISAGY
ncbi:TPA: hypothetical protein ACTXXA_000021 [Legionella anisa]